MDQSTLGDGSADPRIGYEYEYGSTWEPPRIRSKLQKGLKTAKPDCNNDPTVARSLVKTLYFEVALDNDRDHE